MKILFLTSRFYPNIGGVEKHVTEIARELVRRGNKVIVITELTTTTQYNHKRIYQSIGKSDTKGVNSKEPVKSSYFAYKTHKDIDVYYFKFGCNNFFKKFRIWIYLLKNKGLIEEADIVHCHDVFFWYIPFRFLFPRKKAYVTFHGFETKFPPTLKAKLIRRVSEMLSRGNICVGDFIRKWYGTKPNYITYGGITKIQKPKIQNKLGFKLKFKNPKFKILLLGRLEEDNGAKIYLESIKFLRKISISYNLTVCGDGSLRKQFEKYGKVKGVIANPSKYIDRADFVFASSYLSIFEALIRSKKVFSVYSNKLKFDYLNDSPFRKFININSDSFSLINNLINPRTQNPVSDNAYNWAMKQTWSKVTDIYLKLWDL